VRLAIAGGAGGGCAGGGRGVRRARAPSLCRAVWRQPALKEEDSTVPPMPPGAFVKDEGVVPPMPPDAFSSSRQAGQ